MRNIMWIAGAALLVAGCNQSADTNSEANATAAAKPAKPKVNHYCFYKKDAQKGWTASRDAKGNVTVSGKAHLDDVRYKADLGQPDVAGSKATVWLSTTTNTSYAAPGNWWDVSFTIPDSKAVTEVSVKCDAEREFANLKVKPAKS